VDLYEYEFIFSVLILFDAFSPLLMFIISLKSRFPYFVIG
jgi:hypothetical protein